MKINRIKAGDIELQIKEYENEGETIIFLHFGGGNIAMWERAIPYFQDQYRLILVDLRHHGKSDKPKSGFHIDDMASDVAGIMDSFGLDQAHVIGSSLGAEVGLSLAANYPDKMHSLVCEGALHSEYGPYGIWKGSEPEFKEHVSIRLDGLKDKPDKVYESVDELVLFYKEIFEKYGWWNEWFEAFYKYDAHEAGDGKFTASWQNFAKLGYMTHYFNYRFEEYYKQVKCPILMLPDEDVFENELEKNVMDRLKDLVSQAKIAKVPGWNHPYGWMTDPDAGCKEILKFLSNIAD